MEGLKMIKQGAEAKLYVGQWFERPVIMKERFPKKYRHPTLDKSLTIQRTKSEVRSIMRCRIHGIKVPTIYFVDLEKNQIYMEYLHDSITVRDHINSTIKASGDSTYLQVLRPLAEKIGNTLAIMHDKNIIHGDLTTSNMLLKPPADKNDLVLIDFGLGYIENVAEDKGVDLYVLERAFLSTHPNTEELFEVIIQSYKRTLGKKAEETIKKYEEVRLRGRKRTMVG